MVAENIEDLIKKQLSHTLSETNFTKLGKLYKGKVRDNYIKEDKRIMRSKKVRKVILKTPRLRQARNNLRIILKLAVKEKLHRLSKLKRLYLYKKHLTPSQLQRKAFLSKGWNKLYHSFIRSTLQCNCGAACVSLDKAIEEGLNPQDRPTDLDLVWVPWLEKWSCVECFEIYRQGEMTHEDFDDPVWREWVKNEFGI